MKEEKTKSKKKIIYYVVLAVSVLLLVTATVLTVYFMTGSGTNVIAPPSGGIEPGGEEPGGTTPGSGDEEPGEPSGGEDTVRFVSPIEGAAYTVEYNVIYPNETLGWIYRHQAVDLAAEEGTAVRCMADGTVETVSFSEETGNIIVVDHGDGLKTLYRFVEPSGSLKEGSRIKKGEQLGTVAAAYGIERKDGVHLHLEVELNGKLVDPTAYLEPVLSEK